MNKNYEILMIGKIFKELDAVQSAQFDLLLASDEKFRKEFMFFDQLFSDLGNKKEMNLREKLDIIYKEMYGSKNKTKMIQIIKRNWILVAAVVAVLVTVSAFWFSGLFNQSWNEQLYKTYYEEDEVFVNTRSKANFNVDVLHHGMELIENKNFSAALVEFNKLPNSITANYYAGVANMELNHPERAIYKFDYVINDYLNLFYDQAQWYKGLCLVKLEKNKEAIDLFNQISKSESYFKNKAKQILADLKKNS